MPSAKSRPTEPVGTTGISSWRDSPSLRRMMAPLPNSFSTPAMASSRALLRFLSSMIRRLLFLPILRTRSARKKLVGGWVIVLPLVHGAAVLTACEERAPQHDPPLPRAPTHTRTADDASVTEPPRGMREELARLEAEAGIEDSIDPPAPPGNLKAEIESFAGLDRCVRAHTLRDPLLGDAMDALGYDTLTRDACRVLAALPAKSTESCKPIVASPLRHRCESYVAVFTENPKACPTLEGTSTLGARDPSCLARAAKDERLCAAASPPDRVTCRALVRGQISDCGSD